MGATTLSITTFSKTTLSIMELLATQLKRHSSFWAYLRHSA